MSLATGDCRMVSMERWIAERLLSATAAPADWMVDAWLDAKWSNRAMTFCSRRTWVPVRLATRSHLVAGEPLGDIGARAPCQRRTAEWRTLQAAPGIPLSALMGPPGSHFALDLPDTPCGRYAALVTPVLRALRGAGGFSGGGSHASIDLRSGRRGRRGRVFAIRCSRAAAGHNSRDV